MFLPPKLDFQASRLPPPGAVRVVCIAAEYETGDDWPEYLAFPPRVGDLMQSELGKTRKISEVIHAADPDGMPVVMVRLGPDTGAVTPMEGGGPGDTF